MTFYPALFSTLFAAAVSVAAAALLRHAVRRDHAAYLPLLWPWGIFCTLPALAFAVLCLPPFSGLANQLASAITGAGAEILAGIAGVLPGLLWDDLAERIEHQRELPFGLPAALLRAGSLIVLIVLILIPHFFLFNRQDPPPSQNQPVSAAVSEPPAKPSAAPQDARP
jgi:hypothetical protein